MNTNLDIGKRAAKLLELNTKDDRDDDGFTSSEADRLFHTDFWPEKFESAYENAKTPRGKAMATSRRIDHFIKTKGKG